MPNFHLIHSWRPHGRTEEYREVREKTNKMHQLDAYYQYFLNMFRASLCPSSGEQDRVLLHVVCCAGSAGCGW